MAMPRPVRLAPACSFLLGLCVGGLATPAAAEQPGYLRGKVEQKNVLQKQTSPPTIPSGDDPFSGANTGNDAFSPNAGPPPPAAPAGFGDSFSGNQPAPQPQHPPKKAAVASQGPDESPEMQVAWDYWHRRIAGAVFNRFTQMSKAAFKYSEPLACKVSYTVTRDGQIKDIKMLDQSPNMMFNLLVTTALKSISGDIDLLQFPEGSRRLEVEKMATFTQNYGVEGFRSTTGDKEAVRAKGKQ